MITTNNNHKFKLVGIGSAYFLDVVSDMARLIGSFGYMAPVRGGWFVSLNVPGAILSSDRRVRSFAYALEILEGHASALIKEEQDAHSEYRECRGNF